MTTPNKGCRGELMFAICNRWLLMLLLMVTHSSGTNPWSLIHGHSWSLIHGHSWSFIHGHSWSFIHGHSWSLIHGHLIACVALLASRYPLHPAPFALILPTFLAPPPPSSA